MNTNKHKSMPLSSNSRSNHSSSPVHSSSSSSSSNNRSISTTSSSSSAIHHNSSSGGGGANNTVDAENRCLLCACQFTMFRRQHHCRLCNALCCDDCSKKRVVLDSSSVRDNDRTIIYLLSFIVQRLLTIYFYELDNIYILYCFLF